MQFFLQCLNNDSLTICFVYNLICNCSQAENVCFIAKYENVLLAIIIIITILSISIWPFGIEPF